MKRILVCTTALGVHPHEIGPPSQIYYHLVTENGSKGKFIPMLKGKGHPMISLCRHRE